MESIKVEWGVNESSGTESIPLEDMNISSIEAWNALSEDEKQMKLQIAVDELPTRVFAIVESWAPKLPKADCLCTWPQCNNKSNCRNKKKNDVGER